MAEELKVEDKDIYSFTYNGKTINSFKEGTFTVYDKLFVKGDVIERVVIKHGWIYFQRYEKGKWITSPIMPLEKRL